MTQEQFETLVPEKSYVGYAGGKYKVAGTNIKFGQRWVEIYDEPPSNHIDQIQAASLTFIPDSVAVAIPAEKEEKQHQIFIGKLQWVNVSKEVFDHFYRFMPEECRIITSPTTEPVEEKEDELPAGNRIFSIYKQMPDCPLKKFLAKWFDQYDPESLPTHMSDGEAEAKAEAQKSWNELKEKGQVDFVEAVDYMVGFYDGYMKAYQRQQGTEPKKEQDIMPGFS